MSRPTLFIGCAQEDKEVADALQDALRSHADVTIWDQRTVFRLSEAALDSLLAGAGTFDFAIFIMNGLDTLEERGNSYRVPRTNVLFECGLFMATLTRERVFVVYNESMKPRLPSDFGNLTAAIYHEHSNGLRPAVGPVATQIGLRVKELGFRKNGDPRTPTDVMVYWAAPHSNVAMNSEAKQALEQQGLRVLVPEELVAPRISKHRARDRQQFIRDVCRDAIDASSVIVVDVDHYGCDTAWEIGYAEGKGKRVLGYTRDLRSVTVERIFNRKVNTESFMHGWFENRQFDNLEDLADEVSGKIVHVCGPFRNDGAMKAFREIRTAAELLFPVDYIEHHGLPRNYTSGARSQAIELLNRAEVAVVSLPRYGMDTSWQLGYCHARGIPVLGLSGYNDGRTTETSMISDHWMHGWREKLITASLSEVAGIIDGLSRHGALSPQRARSSVPADTKPSGVSDA